MDKPAGPTSHDVLDRLRASLRQPRAGHAGTLDPFATGLLVVCFGRATRLVRFLGGGAKLYQGVIRLGLTTDTDDVTGRPLRPAATGLVFRADSLRRAAEELTGTRLQTPPVFSARKVGGVPAHRRARRGQPVALAPAPIVVHSLELGETAEDRVSFRARVSAGTYVRALARDLGEALGCGACLESLRRLSSEPYRVEDAVAPDAPAEALLARVVPVDKIPLGLSEVALDAETARRFALGQAVACPEHEDQRSGDAVGVVHDGGRLLGIGRRARSGAGAPLIQPEVVFPDRSG